MSTREQTFHPFPRLPLELREEIWRHCLPCRVRELDIPIAEFLYWGQPQPCQLQETSATNSNPPLITRVCHESRKVAHETGKMVVETASSGGFDWDLATATHTTWQDPLRESLHLNWARIYEAGSPSRSLPLKHLVGVGQGVSGTVSLTGEYLFQSVIRSYDIALLNQRASWPVVVRTIIIHSEVRSTAATGLFGLLGDARVQILDVGDAKGIERYLDLARSCEQGRNDVMARQDFRPETVWTQAELLRTHVQDAYGTDLTARICPAVMFRLCTQMCNDRAVDAARERAKEAPPAWGRTTCRVPTRGYNA